MPRPPRSRGPRCRPPRLPQGALDTLLARFVEAYNRKDVAQLAGLFTEDAVLVPPGPILAGKRDIAQYYRTRLEHGAMGLRVELTQAQAEGDPAWAVGRFTVMMPARAGGRRITGATSPPCSGGRATGC